MEYKRPTPHSLRVLWKSLAYEAIFIFLKNIEFRHKLNLKMTEKT